MTLDGLQHSMRSPDKSCLVRSKLKPSRPLPLDKDDILAREWLSHIVGSIGIGTIIKYFAMRKAAFLEYDACIHTSYRLL